MLSHHTTGQAEVIRPNVLVFSPEQPNYDQSSGGNRLYQILKILSDSHNVYYFTLLDIEQRYHDALSLLGVRAYSGGSNLQVLTDLHKSELEVKNAIFCWWHAAETYIPHVKRLFPQAKIIVDTVDVHWVREERGGIGNIERTKREQAVYQTCDVLIAVTYADLDHIKEACNIAKQDTRILSNIHTELSTAPSNGKDILFVGGFNHSPNEKAAIRSYNIFKQWSYDTQCDSKLYLVGSSPTKTIMKLNNGHDVVVTGYVSDLKPYYQKARVVIAPLTWGAGIKGKICEAAMHRVPIISSPIAAEGFGFVNFRDCLIAENDEQFIAALKFIYNCPDHVLLEMTNNAYDKVISLTSVSNARALLNSVLGPPPHVIISIVTYNNDEKLLRCLLSLEHTDYPNYEIVVTDNANSATTRSIVEKFKKVRYSSSPTNLFFIIPNNTIISQHPYSDVVLLNDDTEIQFPNWLTLLNRAAYFAGNVCCAGGKSLFANGDLMEAGSYLFNDGSGINIGRGCDPTLPVYNQKSFVGYVSGSMIYMRRDAINKVGLLDEAYHPMYYEESDWQYRAHQRGLHSVYEPKCSYIHHYRSSSGDKADAWMLENKRKFALKFAYQNIEAYNHRTHDRHVPLIGMDES